MPELLEKMGIKKTRQRAAIVEALEKADKPCCAEEIFRICNNMSLSTVYRNLDRLLELGVLEVLSGAGNEKQRYFQLVSREHRHYAVCLGCHNKIYLAECPVHNMNIHDFTVTGHKVEIYGYCAKCRVRS